MFSLDRWQEVLDTLRRNKLRTILTAVSVAWGILVMVVLLGLGRGLDNGLRFNFRREAANSIWMSANRTSIPFQGYDVGRKLTFENRDFERAQKVAGVDHISGQYFIKGGQFGGGEMAIRRGVKANTFEVNAVHPDAIFLGATEMVEGRFLDAPDVALKRKSTVIGKPVATFLFGDEDPIGQWIDVAGVAFQVVGVFGDEGGEEQERQIYIPVSTAQLAFNGADRLGMISMFNIKRRRVDRAGEGEIKRRRSSEQLAERRTSSRPMTRQAVRDASTTLKQFSRFSKQFFTDDLAVRAS